MWKEVYVSKNVRDKEGQYFFKLMDVVKVFWVKIILLGKLSGGQYLFEILYT